MRTRTAVQRGFNLDYLMWLFTRLSGLVIVIMALVAVAVAFYLGARTQMDMPTLLRWTFFPNPNHVINSEIPDLELGWVNAYWQIMQMLIIFFAGTHGINGLRMVLEDYLSPSFGVLVLRGFFFLLWVFCMIVAVYVILAS
jgi:succinate dehydrogenase hydrophobic anchor subunit